MKLPGMVVRAGQLGLIGAAVAVGAAAVASTQGAGHTVDAVLVNGTTPTVTAPPVVRPTTTTPSARPAARVHRAPARHVVRYRTFSR